MLILLSYNIQYNITAFTVYLIK